ncbi:MAG TPA: class F sortase [Actinomycetes bacterium]|nr:class F sortase [Actinomycetes bacterium]
MSGRGWQGLFALCLAVFIMIPAGWAVTRSDATGVGHLPADVTSASRPTGPMDGLPMTAVPAVGTPPRIPVYDAHLGAAAGPAPHPPAPTELTIKSIGVDAPVETIGVAADGTVAIPHNAYHVGWYRFGPAPGSASGSAVIVGHRDSRTQGRGALYNLGSAGLNEHIQVVLANGRTLTYRIVERRLYVKRGLPWSTFFTATGPPRLTIITCGGPYDRSRGGYQDNLIVTALPVAS